MKQFASYTCLISSSTHGDLGRLVKAINIADRLVKEVNVIFFKVLRTLCPNIEKISAHWRETSFYQQLSQAVQEGHFAKLKSLNRPGGNGGINVYNSTALLASDTLENLYLCDKAEDSDWSEPLESQEF
jgi:hypothetical protein